MNASHPYIKALPYARVLGVQCHFNDETLTFVLPVQDHHISSLIRPVMHSSVVASFLEVSATLHVMVKTECFEPPEAISSALRHFEEGQQRTIFSECVMTRQTQSIVDVGVKAWHDGSDDLIATAQICLRLPSLKS